MKFSIEEARCRIITAQGLGTDTLPFGSGKAGAIKALEHLSYVQIDTISVVERAHHHIFQSRVSDYELQHLHELVAVDRSAFEYWSHAASYLPMRDFRYSLPRKRKYANGENHWFVPTAEHKKQRKIILDRLRAEGPLQSKDFERPAGSKNGWFERTPAKQMLEQLFNEGVLMIRERKGFQKVYDLTERVLPAHVDTSFPSSLEMGMYLVRSALRAQALASAAEIAYLRAPELKESVGLALKKMLASGEIALVEVEGLEKDYFALTSEIEKPAQEVKSARVKILSPFDSIVIQRKRLQDFFDFNYQIECYVPQPKRKYGYFTLPLLYRGEFVGLVDLKAHRPQKKLEVTACFLRAEVKQDAEFLAELKASLKKFALFNGCEKVSFSKRPLLYKA
ncbi:MAG: winged helix-turn-helix domain-containing protein [Bdellovibrionia bacterium]